MKTIRSTAILSLSWICMAVLASSAFAGNSLGASDQLGAVWNQNENGWDGVWTRRGTSDTFDAVWTRAGAKVTAILTMTLTGGDAVSIYRRDISANAEVDYKGTIQADGTVAGTAKVRQTGNTYSWQAKILGASGTSSTGRLGTVWNQSENGWDGVWTRRGTSDTFDAAWTRAGAKVTAILTMTLTGGDAVSIYRRDISANAEVDYTGTIQADGTVAGTAKVRQTGNTYSWQAKIRGQT